MKVLFGFEIAMVMFVLILQIIGHSLGLAPQTVAVIIVMASSVVCLVAVALASTDLTLATDLVRAVVITINAVTLVLFLKAPWLVLTMILIIATICSLIIDGHDRRWKVSVSLMIQGMAIFALLGYGPILMGW